MAEPVPPAFTEAMHAVAGVDGWLTDDQARRLWDAAGAVASGGRIVEIGSHHGRSTIVLARAAQPGVEVVAIDPHAGSDRGPREIHGELDTGDQDEHTFRDNLTRTGVEDRVHHVRLPSQDAGSAVGGNADLLYIDGAHRFVPARADIMHWGRRVADGGTMLIHDSFCSVGVTAAIVDQLLGSNRFEYVGRVGTLAEYRRTSLRGRDRLASTSRQLRQLPWFARNVLVKILLVLHLRPLTRLLGHRGGEWPY